jgi:glycopeptide antibiotics resistance protein
LPRRARTTADTERRWSRPALLLAAYLALLAVLVLLPFGRGMDLGDRLNVVPFATIGRALELGPRSSTFWLMLGNVAAFVPFGILLPLAIRRARSLARVVTAAVLLSAAIEISQLAISAVLGYAYRSSDVDDVILNTIGAALGYVAGRPMGAATPAP